VMGLFYNDYNFEQIPCLRAGAWDSIFDAAWSGHDAAGGRAPRSIKIDKEPREWTCVD
jgi:hypothetical protein